MSLKCMWIDASQYSPKEDETVMCIKKGLNEFPVMCVYEPVTRSYITLHTFQAIPMEVTHWMHLASAPEE